MTEIGETPMPELSPVIKKFILHWGEMGTRWGVNRTVAQVHALLYVSPKPLNAEEIAETLAVARSNVSTSLRELESWGIVKAVHLLGDRREHYESMTDVREMAGIIMDERKRREIDPTLVNLRECVADLKKEKPADAVALDRLTDMLGFLENLSAVYEEMRVVLKGHSKVKKVLGIPMRLWGSRK
jgi:DNA-binding transcriptional regulator GbsR (MarR family)